MSSNASSSVVMARSVCLGRTRLHYQVAGAGPPLVLVHGFSASSSWWRHNIGELATRHRVYALDLAGFGHSRPKYHFSLEHAIEHILIWMQAVGLESAHFCGHSMGGHICIRLAAAHPERVRKLVLASASGLPFNARPLPLLWRILRSSGHAGFRLTPTAVRTSFQAGPLVLLSAMRDLLADDVREELARITAPTLIVWGEQDVLVPLAFGQALHEAIPRSHFVVIPDAGHHVTYEAAAEFDRLVLDFLSLSGR